MSEWIGQIIDRYVIQKKLGEGGMAAVFKAHDTRLDRDVAIKIIRTDTLDTQEFLARFEREAKALAKLQHPNIVNVIDYGDHEGVPYLIMEYISGGTLKGSLWPAGILQRSRNHPCSCCAGYRICTQERHYSPRHQTAKHSHHRIGRSEVDRFWYCKDFWRGRYH